MTRMQHWAPSNAAGGVVRAWGFEGAANPKTFWDKPTHVADRNRNKTGCKNKKI